jgi:outer membrane protein
MKHNQWGDESLIAGSARWRFIFTMLLGGACLWGCLLVANRAAAQDIDLFASEVIFRNNPVIGMGAGLTPDYEGSADFRLYPIFQARFNWADGRYINLLGPVIRADLVPSATFGFGPMLRYRPERGSVDDEKTRLLDKVDAATEAGVFGTYALGRFFLYAALNRDTGDAHDGFLADVSVGYRVKIERHVRMVFLAIGTWADDKYMDTYFSVDADNAEKSDLAEFKAGSGIKDIGMVVALKYNINWHWGITGTWKYTRLLGDAADSPIVNQRGNRNQFINGLVINYNF